MSKVVIQGNASGTGDFTIAAPNSNTDRTLTLPDAAGEVLVNGTTNVGIGTTSPAQKLTVAGTDARIYLVGANTDINMDGVASGQLSLDGNGYAFGIALNASGANLYTNSASRDLIFGTNETERMRIDGSGRVTTPNQPSFHAYASFNLNHGATQTTYVWNLTKHNIGNHYNTTTGRFTAPVAGRYFFGVEALQDVGASSYYTRVFLFKNGASYLDGLNTAALQSTYGKVHINAVVEAAANDYFETVFVSNNAAAFVYGTYSYFSGHLLG